MSLGFGVSRATQRTCRASHGIPPRPTARQSRSGDHTRLNYITLWRYLHVTCCTLTRSTIRASWTRPPPSPPDWITTIQIEDFHNIPITSSHSLGAVYNGFRCDPVRGRQQPRRCRAIYDVPNRISRVIGRSWDLDRSGMSTKVCRGAQVPGPCAHGRGWSRPPGTYLGIDVAIKEVLPSTEYDVSKYFEREWRLMKSVHYASHWATDKH
jgi:hypothetical protein